MSPLTWRLFEDGAHDGAWNMAVDEAMLLLHARGDAPPTLRFYTWEPFCLSLGRLQKQLPPAVLEDGRDFDVVRRPTGGRAVWHAHEITYSVVVRADYLPAEARSVNGAYRWLSEGFLRGLRDLGLEVEMAPQGVRTNGSNCFAANAGCDFVADGKKLIGAAQCRHHDTATGQDAILQHGSLLLSIDERWGEVAGGPMESATSLSDLTRGHALQKTLPSEPRRVQEALSRGFAAVTGGNWVATPLSKEETVLSHRLREEKYCRDSWTFGARNERHILPTA